MSSTTFRASSEALVNDKAVYWRENEVVSHSTSLQINCRDLLEKGLDASTLVRLTSVIHIIQRSAISFLIL